MFNHTRKIHTIHTTRHHSTREATRKYNEMFLLTNGAPFTQGIIVTNRKPSVQISTLVSDTTIRRAKLSIKLVTLTYKESH